MSKKMIYLVSFVLVLSLILTSVGNAAKKPNLIGWWKFDSDTLDYSGLGNEGTAFGDPTFVTGKVGSGALEFDGDDYIRMDGLADDITDNDCTLHAWVKTTDNAGDWFSCNTGTGGNVALWAIDSSQAAMYEGSYQARSTTNVSDGQWHMLTFTRIGSVGTTYVDGVAENTYTANFNFSTTDRWSIAQEWDSDNPSDFLSGTVDDVRFYDRELSAAQVQDLFNGIDPTWLKAEYPNPADGAFHADTWASLSWSPGDTAVSHDVYFSDNFDDVNASAEGASHGNQPSTSFVVGFPGFAFPDGLVPGTTYYWRIDEVNDTEPNSPWKGDVWSFSIPPKTAYLPDPADTAESIDPNADLNWTPGYGAKLHYVYFGDNFDDVNNAAGGLPQGAVTYDPGTLKMAKTYYWRVDEFEGPATHKGDVWSFTIQGAVGSPSPAKGAVDVTQTPTLTWTPGFGASHEVYFGTDASSLENKGSGNLGSESYDPGQLEWNTTYYWRVDEANNANADSPWTGPLWSFTTANFLIIDDMESYNDINEGEPGSNRIYNAWVDGFDDPLNGSTVGHLDPPFYEETIVHSGNKSMPFTYDNAVGKSEATLNLTSNNDWTVNGVDTLTIWYRGGSTNAAETMYVVLNGSAGVDNDNPDAAQAVRWTQWNIPLQAFADQGVNLTNVNSITIGLGNRNNPIAGGTGMMYYDDIRLYAP